MDNEFMKNLATYLVAGLALMIEELVKHPIGTVVSIVGLLYAFDRWRTQRVIHKIKKEELKKLEDERDIRSTQKRKEGSKD